MKGWISGPLGPRKIRLRNSIRSARDAEPTTKLEMNSQPTCRSRVPLSWAFKPPSFR